MTYYHLAGGKLGPGSIVDPGNWGRIVRIHGWNHTAATREMALEGARISKFSAFPSRLDCCFAFASLDEAKAFQTGPNGFNTHLLYRVTLIDPFVLTGITSWALSFFNGALRHDWADDYWRAMKRIQAGVAVGVGEGREVLTLSPLRIEECLSP